MSEDREARPLRQIDSLTATVDQLQAELESLDMQVLLLTLACGLLVGIVGGMLLWNADAVR